MRSAPYPKSVITPSASSSRRPCISKNGVPKAFSIQHTPQAVYAASVLKIPCGAYYFTVIFMKRNLLTLLFAVLFVLCLVKSDAVATESAAYLRLCGLRVVPSLFVFSVLCSVLCQSPCFFRLCALPYFGAETAVLLIGMLGGFPLGATAVVALYESGAVSKRQAEYLCAFCNNPSLSFIVGYVGAAEGRRMSITLALLCAASAVLIALVLKRFYLRGGERLLAFVPIRPAEKPTAKILAEGCAAMLSVCGCIVFFGSIGALLPRPLSGFLELCGGISRSTNPVYTAALVGFSGVSVIMQIATVCGGRFSLKPFVVSKLFQSVFMAFGAYICL